ARPPAPQPADAPDQAAAPLRVLLVEDNEINRFVARSLLEEADHSVTEAAHGAEGVARAAAEPFDVILMDISMPQLDGVEATRAIRAGGGASAGARIVALTAHAPPAEMATFRAAGIDACVEKPVTRSLLDRALRSLGGDWPAPAEVPGPPSRSGPAATPADPDPAAAAPLLDRARMADFVALLGADQAQTLTRRFLADAEAAVAQIAAPLRDDDEGRRAAGKLCHRLAGSAATFGALRLRQNLLWIEAALDRGAPAKRLRADLPELWERTEAAIRQEMPQSPDQPAARARSA
ncbi:MAG: response regulator, partial [Rhodobacterales bacterium]|nr:response regulator [Rhodobacterales bacterium]